MSANPLPKRLLSLVLTLCMVLSLVPMSALAAGDPSNDSNNPNTAVNAIVNGSFEQPGRTDKNAPQLDDVPGWSTTATDHLIEFGVNTQANSAPQLSGNDKSIPDGNQFAELNADEVSTLYQNVSTVGGHIYEWGLSHRGRAGTDTMALIIGPHQDNAPAKPDKTGQDQFMRLTDWVKRNAKTLGVTVPTDGCSQRITVYSKKFDENGGFLNNPGNESPFSTAPSNLYTETWSVWIIATGNQSWGSYGTHDPTYDPLQGIGGGIGCSYTVPVGQKETTFAFCSYSSSGSGGLTVGNLLDNITFSLYHNVTFTTTAGGEGTVSAEIQGATQTVDFSDKNAIDVPVRNNRQMILTAPATADSGVTTFVGAYITQHRTDGSFTEFVDKSKWTPNGTTYTYTGTVTAPTDVVLVFVRSPAVTYDANGGDKYVHTLGAQEPTDVVSFAAGTESYTSHAATASRQTGWVFDGWLLARAGNGLVLPAKHTVSYANGVFTFTYQDGAEKKQTPITANGVALLAQWKWQQTFQTQLQQGDTVTDTDACGTITKDDSDASVKTYNAATGEKVTVTANAKPDYAFLGWYRTIDGQLQLVSQKQTYTYTVGKQGVQTVYARFAQTYTITYAWDTSNSPTDQIPEAPEAGTATEGTTYPLSQTFVPQQTTVSATVNGVPGHWLFQGWKEKDGTDYLGREIANVTRNYTLVGSWDFIPNAQYDLSYSMGDTEHCWIPSGGLGSIPSSRHYAGDTVTSAAAPTIPAEQNTILAAKGTIFQGTWTFQGWKRSDTGETVSAENSAEKNFSMPNQDLTLTAQWKFTPNVYTVKYDLNKGSGTVPEAHTSYEYTELNGKDGAEKPSGIPFGASLIVQNFTGTAPDGTYFAGWGRTPDGPVAYEPGEDVSNASLGITEKNATVTLYAIYAEEQTITVEFQGNNPQWGAVTPRSGSFTVTDSVSGNPVTSTAKPSPGYHFVEWTQDGKQVSINPELTISANQFKHTQAGHTFVYVAHFEPNRFTVHFDQNTKDTVKGTMADQKFQYAEAENAYLRPNAFVRPGYRFLGWSETEDGTGTSYADQAKFQGVPAKNEAIVNLYAQWQEYSSVTIRYTAVPNDLGTVTLNKENQTASAATQETGSPDPALKEIVGATATAAQGSVFEGWYDQHGTRLSTERRYEPKTVNDLYEGGSYVAHFHAQQYTLRFNANGGEGTMGNLTYTHGQDQSLTKCGFTRAGYDFLGWATAADGNVAYHDQQSLSITQDTTLYAVWKQQPNQGGSGGGHHNSGGTQEKPDETPPTTLNDTDHYAYIVGYEDGTIRPNGHITRAEAATVFFRLLTDKARDANLTDRSPYPDVSAGDWYNKAIATLSRMGILSGYEDGSFRPNATVTRAEFAAMAARFDTEAKPMDMPFTDLTGCWAADEIAKAYGKGWVNGYGDNTFRPNGPITRAEAVTLINRVLRRLPETDKDLLPDERTWPDNPETFWGYLALQEASNSHLYDRKSNGYETQTKILPPRDWSQEFEQ